MKKRIAVLIRDRQEEALRMGIGLTILNDEIELFILDKRLEQTENAAMNLEMITDLDIKLYTNTPDNTDMIFIPNDKLAGMLLKYDHVIAY